MQKANKEALDNETNYHINNNVTIRQQRLIVMSLVTSSD